jgi:murein DD-endopeptidase MepM/ murein hydrolase activator NlpD
MLVSVLVAGVGRSDAGPADADERAGLGLPVACRLGEECFVQQMPDIDPGEGVRDPLCGKASYQGHDGWDIRVRTLKDIGRAAVVSVADGTVLRVRDGVPDRIFDRSRDGDLLGGKECGNGVVVGHANGVVSQYGHLAQGSITVRPSAHIAKRDSLGSIGASGLAEFPHVHLSIRRDGAKVEPLTGQRLAGVSEACGDTTASLFAASVARMLSGSSTAILDGGLAADHPELQNLVREGAPPLIEPFQPIFAWVWAINVDKGSLFRIRLLDPDRIEIMDVQTKPLEGRKANYLAFAGARHSAKEGTYDLRIDMLDGAATIRSMTRSINVAN